MNIAVKSALASAVVALAHACATPVEIGDEILVANPSDFGDAGLLGGAAGDVGQGGASPGGSGSGVGGSASGTAGAGTGGTGVPVGLSGAGGLPGGAGAGGTSNAGAGGRAPGGGSGGSAGSAAGTGGTGGAAAGTGGTGGPGGSGGGAVAVFDRASCDFSDTTGCDALDCQARCSANDGGSCSSRCLAVVDCVADVLADDPDAACVSEDDPLCGGRDVGQPRACTGLVDSAGGLNTTGTTQPAFIARQFVECICSVPRP